MKREEVPGLGGAPAETADRGVLRFLTCGSVDDGKSTLIGRLLYDTKAILADTLHSIERTSKKRGLEAADLSLLTDGLQAEREQGITIDVAYRYFSTGTRKYIIAETATTTITERGATRLDDQASEAAMEQRKKEGYF